jgi:hypothetical protein
MTFPRLDWKNVVGAPVAGDTSRLYRGRLTSTSPVAAIIRCTADAGSVDKRTQSKWSRALRYAARYKVDAEPLAEFIKRKGGINECNAR